MPHSGITGQFHRTSIRLPPGAYSALADHLPVTWEEFADHYVWDSEDSSSEFELIVSSPAYVGFVFRDSEDKHVTIKVSMKLLNLTMESPIVTQPMPVLSV
jgi:hypothetical protein